MMNLPLFRRRNRGRTISALYGMIVAQARTPGFYRDYGVPDTVNGRFDLLVAHLALVTRRLSRESDEIRNFGQDLFDHFCTDMDRNLREIGISDLKVPKEMSRIGEAFYGRLQAYDEAIEAGDEGRLAQALSRNVLGQDAVQPSGRRLAAYIRAADADLAGQDAAELVAGKVRFPALDTIAG